ncbi:MAG: aminoacetone oxidase family FAD-binding enzyme [Chlorobiaceae bacterium]|nr:aminoacetone oxidase family FAD-binding enzyme [Chlorobiaceae bacterium]
MANELQSKKDRQGTSSAPPVLLIVGAGASGMLAAVSARRTARSLGIADDRFRIVLIERNLKPGNKIAISGGGHCNITHDGPVDLLLEKGFLKKNEQRFVRHAVYRFTNADLLVLLASYGVQSVVKEDGRVFPASMRSGDVLAAIWRMVEEASAEMVTNMRVDGLEISRDGFEVRAGSAQFTADSVILATGGASWGSAGTLGDGIRLAVSVGLASVPTLPALAPIFFSVPPKPELVGVSLRGIGLLVESGSESDSRRGDLLISHRGISGPACLSLSRSVAGLFASGKAPVMIMADFFPGHDEGALSAFILDHAARRGTQLVRTFLQRCPLASERLAANSDKSTDPSATIPNVFAAEIMRLAGIGNELVMSGLTREHRRALVTIMKRLPLGKVRKVPLDKAEVSAGGISLAEINPKSMESRLHPRLYCCGEVLDYVGEVGGFNLQAAFSTGWVAGIHAARSLLDASHAQTAQE